MRQTESIEALAEDLAKAQGAITNAKRDSENPHLKSRYADLAAIWDACRTPLSEHGLSVVQSPRLVAAGEAVWMVEVETILLHRSGQSIRDVLAVPVGMITAQGVGSAITYARRYALAAFVGVAPEDDDAQAARSHDRDLREDRPVRKAPTPRPVPVPDGPPTLTVKIRVLGILQRPIGTEGRVKFVITGDDQKTYQTLRLEEATTAKTAQEAGLPIEIVYQATPEGRLVHAIREIGTEVPR